MDRKKYDDKLSIVNGIFPYIKLLIDKRFYHNIVAGTTT